MIQAFGEDDHPSVPNSAAIYYSESNL